MANFFDNSRKGDEGPASERGLAILEANFDADTSNHHRLLTRSPLAASVLFLSHDGDTRVVFDSASAFLEAVRKARDSGLDVPGLHPACSPVAQDQAALSTFIRGLLDAADLGDAVVALVPSMDLQDADLLRRLAQDEDFHLGEAVGIEIGTRPSPALLQDEQVLANSLADGAQVGVSSAEIADATAFAVVFPAAQVGTVLRA
ncbi:MULTISPECIES: hypothetical protein [unclassified Variovorax]|uniref:hypothetical protein n=1 Tax=unclassified Variovorax TaxID=663243 RepID=UPI0008B142F6|nr:MULTISPECIES: hypothetical protein [unclassified Variovorax]SEK16778.1 hypothetical protein SAMN05518853_13036 [Variovorax sp. OK202]SFE58959.1 hypothetical protein SAMN05444746_12936 [Variovorax sp. OK212]